MTSPSYRRRLADRAGILAGFTDNEGTLRETSEETRVRLLRAMGFDAETEESARAEVERLEARDAHRLLDPVAVVSVHDPAARRLSGPSENGERGDVQVTVTAEDGSAWSLVGPLGSVTLPELEPGCYRVNVEGADRHGEQFRIVHPGSCYRVGRATSERRRFGIWANLYAVRSDRNWGVGDLGDLRDLVAWAGEEEAAFVGINPLHALRNTPPDVSPYYPVSRIFVNPIYLDLERVPEWAACAEARAEWQSPAVQEALVTLRAGPAVDYAAVWDLKSRFLALLHAVFEREHRQAETERGRQFARFCERYRTRLTEWCGWMADRQPGTTADYHAYLQFAMDEQLAEVAGVAGDSGLELGLYVDLAVGAAQDGADAAAFPGLFVRGATIGAPPDAYAEGGQDWSLHPLHPIRLRDSGYRYWRQMLGAAMRHAGAVRIDHVMGVERQFWIPDGCTARDGAYVQYPAAELFGVLALESERHRAVVVGESLGTLPDGFLERLHGWGILSSQVLYFEREADGSFKASDDYSSQAMVTLNTHDLATWTGFWTGRDLDQRRETGVISEARWERLRVEREGERARLAERIGAAELAGNGPGEDTAAALCPVVHEFLGRTPAPLVGVALGDLAGEATGVNVPGAPLDRYAAWTRRQRQSLDAIRNSHLAQETLTAVRGTGRGRSEPEG